MEPRDKIIKISASDYPDKFSFNCIDLFKFIGAILVCILHIGIFTASDSRLAGYAEFLMRHAICRIAVPFYFVTAGFLLFRKTDIRRIGDYKDRIQNYCFKILRLLGMWTVLLIVGSTVQLWYLGGLVVAVTFISLLLYFKVPMKWIIVFAVLLYVIGLFGDAYSGFGNQLRDFRIFSYLFKLFDAFFDTTRNGIFMGFIFVLIGALFAHKKIVMNFAVAVFGFFISTGLLLLEAGLLKYYSDPKDYNMYISLLPTVFFLFYIATHINFKDRKIYSKLRVVGMLIFYLHLFVQFVVNYVAENLELNFDMYSIIIVLILTSVIAFIIEWMSRKEKFSWLRWFYS